MLLSKTVMMKWNFRTKKHYENKGYPFTKMGDEFEAIVEDLTNGSNAKVNVKCDYEDCKDPYLKPMSWYRYTNYVYKDGKYYCQKCAMKLFGGEKTRKTKLQNGKSFYDWCYENLSKEEADKIMLRWDYDKNIKNGEILTPKNVSYGSNGLNRNRKGYWFKCLDYPEHESELKNINSFTSGQEGSMNCSKCISISTTHPEFCIFFIYKKDTNKYSYGLREKLLMKCPNCGHEKKISLNTLINSGFGCIKCGDGISYPEKFMFNFLEQLLNTNFQTQLTKTTFKWCDNYKYDFYVDKINTIIEIHGLQHYKEGFEKIKSSKRYIKTLKEEQENDKIKDQLAKENGIDNYIILDCRYSELNWIKNSIINSELPQLLNFTEDDIDWLKCHEFACNSLVKKVCELWNNKIKNIDQIAEIIKISRSTILKYLKQGAELSWCNYDSKKIIENNLNMMHKNNSKQVICITTREVFDSITNAQNKYNINNISLCCNGKQKSAGKLEDGTKLRWMHYDEYIEQQNNNLLII